jgi:hypothetical protein
MELSGIGSLFSPKVEQVLARFLASLIAIEV